MSDQGLADMVLDGAVDRFDLRRHGGCQCTAFRRQAYQHATLVFGHALAPHQAGLVHACQHARQARTGDQAHRADLARLQRPALEQRAHDAPLLLGDAVGVQDRPEVRHHAFARLQQQQ